MKSIFTILSAALFSGLAAQSFNAPESVEYDGSHHRWIVGNKNAGTVSSFYPQSSLAVPFSTGSPLGTGPHGIEILGNVVYCCDGANIQGFDITTGAPVFTLNCGASFLNGITSDGVSTLFATDFNSKKIYRIVPANNHYNIMATTVKTPNGIIYDGANNRCVFVTWGAGASLQAMSLADSSISNLVTSTYSNFDGVTFDHAGYWYASCWSNNSLIRWTPTYTTPTVVMTGLSGPADIVINTAGDSIAIPNSSSTSVVFYTNITTGISPLQTSVFSIFPNPTNSSCTINFKTEQFNSDAILMDTSGRIVRKVRFSGNVLVVDKGELDSGIYLIEIIDENGFVVSTDKIVFK